MCIGGCANVLVVDDDDDIRETVREVLSVEGYRVEEAKNGLVALEHLRATDRLRPCVILLDVMMPVMDGWQFRIEQTRDPVLASIPVVVLTADGSAVSKALAMNAAAGLTKPFQLEQLLAALELHCSPYSSEA